MLLVIYICCLDATDATVYASAMLNIRLRSQQSEAQIIDKLAAVPAHCTPLDIRATPQFWTAMTHPAEEVGPNNWKIEIKARRNVAAREARRVSMARTIATAITLRGGVIRAPYDVPAAMDERSIEDWLNRD